VLYDPEQPSYNSEARQIAGGSPDAYVIIDFPETYQKVGPALVRTGQWDASKTFITDGLVSGSLPEDVGSEATEGLRGTAPGTPQEGGAAQAFGDLYERSAPRNVDRQTFDGQNFDAVILCYLAAVAAGEADGEKMKDELQNVSGPGGDKYTFEQLPDAIRALQDGNDIDYEGAAGPIDLDDNGDPTAGVYDVVRFRNGEIDPIRQVPIKKEGT
jgi:branched-chain amino acid transport system substrate-binding protein